MIRPALLASALLVLAGACVASDPPHTLPAAPGLCSAEHATALVGKTYSPAMDAEVKRLTGATTIRALPPGAAATMDFREDRVNLDLDAEGRIVAVRCG